MSFIRVVCDILTTGSIPKEEGEQIRCLSCRNGMKIGDLARDAFISYMEQAVREYDELLDTNIPFSEKLEQIMTNKSNAIKELRHSDFDQQALEDKVLRPVWEIPLISHFFTRKRKPITAIIMDGPV